MKRALPTLRNLATRTILPAAAVAVLLAGTPGIARADDDGRVPVSVGFVYPLATNANRPNVTSSADLSVLYGRVGRIEGAQLGGVVAHASRGVEGAQIGSVTSIAGGSVAGAQLSGAVNVASELAGAQLATVNVAGDVDGVQLGVINVGRKVRGLQLGVINIADEVDGAAIGLVSISRDSIHPIVWSSNLQYMNAGVKFSTKYVFTTLAMHIGTPEADFDNIGATLAIGGHVPLPARFDVEVQGSFTQLAPRPSKREIKPDAWFAPQVVGGYSFGPHLRAFVGGGVRLPISLDIGRDVIRPEVLAGVQF